MIKKIFIAFSVLLLIYMIWPGPNKMSDFKPLPNSSKSKLAGDTWQIPNVVGYFSNNYREFVVSYYLKNYQQLSNFPFPPLKLNRPPEYSWQVIKKHTDSTYIEELVYPLRDSLYVNGFEPFYPDGSPKFWGSITFDVDGLSWFTKTTLRFYPSNVLIRIIVWLGIITLIYLLVKLGKRIIF